MELSFTFTTNSSLIRKIEYFPDFEFCTVYFHKYFTDKLHYRLTIEELADFISAKSVGKHYLQTIKTKKMADEKQKPKGVNKASTEKRFIKMRLDVTKINKAWLLAGQKGTYMDLTLHMLPDGEVDGYENLGMITQDVPKDVYKVDKKAKGPILGNGKEITWDNSAAAEGSVGEALSPVSSNDVDDDLPF